MVGDILTPEIVSAHAAQLLKRRIAEREEINRNYGLGKPQMARLVPTETGVVMVDVETPDEMVTVREILEPIIPADKIDGTVAKVQGCIDQFHAECDQIEADAQALNDLAVKITGEIWMYEAHEADQSAMIAMRMTLEHFIDRPQAMRFALDILKEATDDTD